MAVAATVLVEVLGLVLVPVAVMAGWTGRNVAGAAVLRLVVGAARGTSAMAAEHAPRNGSGAVGRVGRPFGAQVAHAAFGMLLPRHPLHALKHRQLRQQVAAKLTRRARRR